MEKIGECASRLSGGNGSFAEAPPLECVNGLVFILINLAFGFLGVTALFYLMFGGIKFVMSNGDPKAIKSAKETITFAIIGTILVISTYVLANLFVRTFLPDASIFNFHVGPEPIIAPCSPKAGGGPC